MKMINKYTPYYKRILALAMPVVLAQAGQLTTQFADTAMVGNFGGEDPIPLAAVSLGSSLFLLIYLAALGLALAITPLVGEQYAKDDSREVGCLFQNSILYCMLIGVVATVVAVALRPFISVLGVWMSAPGQSIEAVAAMALPYYDMLVWSIIPLMLFLAIKQFLEGIGNTKTAMWITLAGNALNILLNYIFIFGKWGVEAMGAEGAGLATLISRIMQMVATHLSRVLQSRGVEGEILGGFPKGGLSDILPDGDGVGSLYPHLYSCALVWRGGGRLYAGGILYC